jgi:CO/xanthine dehydrogenase FAD-binding subunit
MPINLWNEYLSPATITEALRLLSQYGDQARIIAGGTDLMLDLAEKRIAPTRAVIDITRIPELSRIETRDHQVFIGAAVTFSQILKSAELRRITPFLADAVQTIGGRQIRNLGTLVGNVVNASPAADGVPPLYALNTNIHILSENNNQRQVPIADFIQGVRKVSLEDGEMVAAVSFPIPSGPWRMAFRKVGLRRSMAIALTNIAVMILVEADMLKDVRIALGAIAPTVLRMKEAEQSLIGLSVSEGLSNEAPRLSRLAARPIDDFRASAAYRRTLVENLVRGQLNQLLCANKC